MDLNNASLHQLRKEYDKHIGIAIYDLQDEGPIYMSSLVEEPTSVLITGYRKLGRG